MTEFMPFIVASNADKADPVTRKLIRSHARRGKKKQGRLDRDGHGASPGPVARRNQKPRARLEEIAGMYTPVVPGRIGSDFSFVESADEMGPAILLNLTKGLSLSHGVRRLRRLIPYEYSHTDGSQSHFPTSSGDWFPQRQ